MFDDIAKEAAAHSAGDQSSAVAPRKPCPDVSVKRPRSPTGDFIARSDDGSDEPEDDSDDSDDDSDFVGIYFLDVGMGDSTLIIDWKAGKTVLIDCGSTKNQDTAGAASLTFIKDRLTEVKDQFELDYPYIDQVFFTHPDRDHYNLFPQLLIAIPELIVGTFAIGGRRNEYGTPSMAPYFAGKTLREFGSPFSGEPSATSIGNFTVQVLCANQTPLHRETSANASSLCILLRVRSKERHEHKILFVGDSEKTVEEVLMANHREAIRDCLALKVGHHGSESACSQEFLNLVNPKFAYVSADMTWSHPYSTTVKRILAALERQERTLKNDPQHAFTHGEGGSRNRAYRVDHTPHNFYTNIVVIQDDTTGSEAAVAAQRAGDNPVIAEGVRHDLAINLMDGSVEVRNSGMGDSDSEIVELFRAFQ